MAIDIATAHQSVAKICGAGGGGCVLVWAPERKQKVAEECHHRCLEGRLPPSEAGVLAGHEGVGALANLVAELL